MNSNSVDARALEIGDLDHQFASANVLRYCFGKEELIGVMYRYEFQHRNNPPKSELWEQIESTVRFINKAFALGVADRYGISRSVIENWKEFSSNKEVYENQFSRCLAKKSMEPWNFVRDQVGCMEWTPESMHKIFNAPLQTEKDVDYLRVRSNLARNFRAQDIVEPKLATATFGMFFLHVEAKMMNTLTRIALLYHHIIGVCNKLKSLGYNYLELNLKGDLLIETPYNVLRRGDVNDEDLLEIVLFDDTELNHYLTIAEKFKARKDPERQKIGEFYHLMHERALALGVINDLSESLQEELLELVFGLNLNEKGKDVKQTILKNITPQLFHSLLPIAYVLEKTRQEDILINYELFAQNMENLKAQYEANSGVRLNTLDDFYQCYFERNPNITGDSKKFFDRIKNYIDEEKQKPVQPINSKGKTQTDLKRGRDLQAEMELILEETNLKNAQEANLSEKEELRRRKQMLINRKKYEKDQKNKLENEKAQESNKTPSGSGAIRAGAVVAKKRDLVAQAQAILAQMINSDHSRVGFWHCLDASKPEDLVKVRERWDQGVQKYQALDDHSIQTHIWQHSLSRLLDKVMGYYGDRTVGYPSESGRSLFLQIRKMGEPIEQATWGFLYIGYQYPKERGKHKGLVIHRQFVPIQKEEIKNNSVKKLADAANPIRTDAQYQDEIVNGAGLQGFSNDSLEFDPNDRYVEVIDVRNELLIRVPLKS